MQDFSPLTTKSRDTFVKLLNDVNFSLHCKTLRATGAEVQAFTICTLGAIQNVGQTFFKIRYR